MKIMEDNGLERNIKYVQLKIIKDVIYCKKCGSEYKKNEISKNGIGFNGNCFCGSYDFITGDLAENIAGFLDLCGKGLLKRYYEKIYEKEFSIISDKRIMMKLLIKNGLIDSKDREMENIICKIILRKF